MACGNEIGCPQTYACLFIPAIIGCGRTALRAMSVPHFGHGTFVGHGAIVSFAFDGVVLDSVGLRTTPA